MTVSRVVVVALIALLASASISAQDASFVPAKAIDKKFLLLGGALNVSMILDTKSTFDVLRRCDRCVESNPYAAPFINRGPAVAFMAGEALGIGVLAVAARMRVARSPVVRHIWWVIPAALASGHLVAYRHNLHMAR